ncbi:hypothetical protein DFH08DRAFT_1084939 [Mycena albidolilacea]|uniref:Uncharacterized protein n=1 Tax=Mycena albidolilacea TaxID=1033008 RepID=A0AAD7EJ78_9AGAR|nr:hypothetical protein DFH08DRAFT_1084939 [Mycena albidolilacea]
MLASIISYRPNRKKVSSKSPFSLKRPDPASPHPYATQVFDIGDSSFEEVDPDAVPASRVHDPVPKLSPPEPVKSPRVDIDIDLTPADWFPSHFLKTDSIAGPSSLTGAATAIASSANASKSAETFETDGASDEEEEEDEDEDEDDMSEEDFVSNLEGLDASHFLNLPESDRLMPPPTSFPRKAAPSPIKIPNASLHGPRVQLVRSSTAQSRPESTFSFEGVSAVSGTTIARALIGDSFVLSNDRSSKYRSGASVLTRSDSATLPRGEHPFSPAWSIRKSGAFTPIDAMGMAIPPVPQMPEELRRAIAESRDKLRVDESAERRNRRRSGSDAETPITPLMRTNSGSRIRGEDTRRISRISEAPTTSSTAPMTPNTSATDSVANTEPSPNTSNFQAGASPASFPTSPGESTNSISDTRSSRDIDNVLDYYNFEPSPGYPGGQSAFDLPSPDAPIDPNRFQPAFSPITEESGSQLSPNSFRSRRTNGTNGMSATPSPSTGGGRVEWRPSEIRSLPPHPLLPIGGSSDRPRSGSGIAPITIPPPPLLAYEASSRSSLDTDDDHLVPPSRSIFNRQRSGSAPSPIKVVRDSRDITAYNITVTPLVGTSSNATTPVTADSDNVLVRQEQTFPETPSAFSPTFSPGTDTSAADRYSMMQPPIAAAARPGYTNLAQQMLLTRAATTVRGARHSRQASMTRARNRSTAIFPSEETANMLKEALPKSPEDEPVPPIPSPLVEEEEDQPEEDSTPRQDEHGHPSSPPNDSMSVESASVYSPSVRSFPSPPMPNMSIHRLSGDSHWNSLDSRSQDYHEKPLEKPLPVPPVSPDESQPVIPPPPVVEAAPAPSLTSASSSSLARLFGPTPSASPAIPPAIPPQSLSRRSSPSPAPVETEEAASSPAPSAAPSVAASPPAIHEPAPLTTPPVSPRHPNRPPLMLTPPPSVDPSLGSPHIVPVMTPARGDSPGFGSPPPYYTVMYDRDNARDQERMTPSTGGSGGYADHFSPFTPSIPLRDQRTLSIQSLAPTTPGGNGRRARPRPPLPVGPRRPSTSGAAPPSHGRNRNGSVSSLASQMPGRRSTASPRFQTPQPKWRGYTMDAAKWTFSSSQLQGIVSRAIRQSAEASSIRLLRMETVDSDIPEEVHRLEMQRTDVKTRYKMLTRRRTNLYAQLTGHLDGTEPDDPTNMLRTVENLKEISAELDRLAEDLHSADEQIAQLTSLRDVHSASALAMALRKLNASFLKQIGEAEALRQQVETLQAERDEAWSQAVDVANDYDDLNERIEMTSPGPSSQSKRSSRVLAVKKSSIRVSKAGLRSSTSRRSSVSSVGGGNRASSSGLPSATFEDIPPVPPMPRRRPQDIRTDLASRVSSALVTTPTSETRALDQAQAELYSMLGLTVPDKNARRSHSVNLSAASDTENPLLSTLAASARPGSNTNRPSSLPPNSQLSEVLSALTADRNAMMVTLGMLDD